MSERDDKSIDHELSGIAMAATHEHEQTVSRNEIESALDAVRSRIAAGDLGGVPPSIDVARERRRRSPLTLIGAAAAVIGMIALGLVAVVGGNTDDRLVPATVPEMRPTPVTEPTIDATVPTTDATVPTTDASVPTTDVAEPDVAEPDGADAGGTAPPPAIAQPTAIEQNCVDDGWCTSLAATGDGRLVALDPTRTTLSVFDPTGQQLLAQAAIDVTALGNSVPWLVAVGPDDVAYLQYATPGVLDPSNDLAAVPLPSGGGGEEPLTPVMVWTGLDGSGDSTLILRKAGLTVVPCCGGAGTRPTPDATVYRWVDRNGAFVESAEPTFDLNLGDAGSSLTRIDTLDDGTTGFMTFSLPTAYQNPRDFPYVRPTDDGGAVAYDLVQSSEMFGVFVHFDTDWPENGINNSDVFFSQPGDYISLALIEPDGNLIISGENGFERVTLDQVGVRGWGGKIEIDRTAEALVIDAPGLNDHVEAEQPFWARVPDMYALQLKQFIGPNESVQVDYDEASTSLTITTTGFLDDSIAGERWSIDVEVGDDGLFRFVSGSSAFNCQPGRGHQDFSLELCI